MKTASDFQYDIQQSRFKIANEYAALVNTLDVTKSLRYSVQQKPRSWISGFFLMGLSLPWLFKKSTPTHSQELTPSTGPSSKKEKKSSVLSKIVLVATPLLQNKTLRSALLSKACFILPLVQEAIIEYASHRKNKKQEASTCKF